MPADGRHLYSIKKIFVPLRKKLDSSLIKQSDTPLIIYLTVILGMLLALRIKRYHEDLSLNLLSEIIGAAFTLFVIDVLLVKSKTKSCLIYRTISIT